MSQFQDSLKGNVLLGVCGSIAAYRSPDLLKELKKNNYQVRVSLTQSAREFVSAKVLETFSAQTVLDSNIFSPIHQGTDHIDVARWANKVVVYGATANFIAKLANGIADDFLSLQILALDRSVPVYIVPAMNSKMWENPIVQANVEKLRSFQFQFIGPIEGQLACGEKGIGHIAEIQSVIEALEVDRPVEKTQVTQNVSLELKQTKMENFWSGKKVLISAGPMKTPLDSVRYLQNSSSGKMGLALARAAKKFGARVSILLGPVEASLKQEFREFHCIEYDSADDYEGALEKMFPWSDVFFSAAAVLDFQVVPGEKKIAREDLSEELKLVIRPVPDFVKKVCAIKTKKQVVFSFALEKGTVDECLERAAQKLKRKGADFILMNRCSNSDKSGPFSDLNEMWLLSKFDKRRNIHFAPESKFNIALKLFDHFSKIKKASKALYSMPAQENPPV